MTLFINTAVTMPLDNKALMKALLVVYNISVSELAARLQVSARTLYRLQKGIEVNPDVALKMIKLYCQRYASIKK